MGEPNAKTYSSLSGEKALFYIHNTPSPQAEWLAPTAVRLFLPNRALASIIPTPGCQQNHPLVVSPQTAMPKLRSWRLSNTLSYPLRTSY